MAVNNFGPFFLSSFLIYVLAASKEWEGLPHSPWTAKMPIYQYYKDLQEAELCKEFMRGNDIFLGRLVFEIQGHENHRLSEEAI